MLLNSQKFEDLQDKIFQKMPVARKVKIASQLFLLGKKLESLRSQSYGKPKQGRAIDPRGFALSGGKDS